MNQTIRGNFSALGQEKVNDVSNEPFCIPIAVVGMSGIFPESGNLQDFWTHIVRGKDCISEVPPTHWDPQDYFDPNPTVPDKTYSKRGGFIPEIDFDPMEFGIPPVTLDAIDVSQLLSLIGAKHALMDAGYLGENARFFDRERTGVILGFGGYGNSGIPLFSRIQYPLWQKILSGCGFPDSVIETIVRKMKDSYLEWEENSFPGLLGNIVAGRVCNRFDLGGTNATVDAACASSLAALKMAVSELILGHCDVMISGGVDTNNSIFSYLCFSKTPALSLQMQSRPFDAESDGILLGEGIGMLVLKRLKDAERDGDRVYAVIRGIGSSSDGRHKSIYAPRSEGQIHAIQRAYRSAKVDPATVGLIEGHGTGTVAGDQAEWNGIHRFFQSAGCAEQSVALGSVKSQIGHTKLAAGAASLIKTVLALHHKILPPTINVTKPNPRFESENSPLYINTETRPWFRRENQPPRRAGVSSFGFGGTNYHVILEEYEPKDSFNPLSLPTRVHSAPEIVFLHAETPAQLRAISQTHLEKLQYFQSAYEFTEWIQELHALPVHAPLPHARTGFVAESVEGAVRFLHILLNHLNEKENIELEHPLGLYYRPKGLALQGRVAALFSGQGTQHPNMGMSLALNHAALRQAFEVMDDALVEAGLAPITDFVYPVPCFDAEEKKRQEDRLTSTEQAQSAIGAFNAGLYRMLQDIGFRPDFAAGHSFGELSALWAAGAMSEADYYRLSIQRGLAMKFASEHSPTGGMLAVTATVSKLDEALRREPALSIANYNAPMQSVVAGPQADLQRLQESLVQEGIEYRPLPVSTAFHTPVVSAAYEPFAQACSEVAFQAPTIPVYANQSGEAYPNRPEEIQRDLAEQLLHPVHFSQEIEAIYRDGGFLFVEFGPRNVLTNLVRKILQDRPHAAVSIHPGPSNDEESRFLQSIAQLKVMGLELDHTQIHPKRWSLKKEPRKATTIRLNGSGYMTPKTKQRIENALNPEPIRTHSDTNIPANHPVSPAPPDFPPSPVPAQISDNGDRSHSAHGVALPSQASLALLENQYLFSQVHQQYLESQTRFFSVMEKMSDQTQSMLQQHAPHPQFTQIVEVLQKQLSLMQRNQEGHLRVHEQYMHNQIAFLNGSNGKVVSPSPLPEPIVAPAEPALRIRGTNGNTSEAMPPPVVESIPKSNPVAKIASASDSGPSREVIVSTFLRLIGDKTGYPTDMLDTEMDLEADLGIDSIKRVEILAAIQEVFPDLPVDRMEDWGTIRTIGQIIDKIQNDMSKSSTSRGESAPVVLSIAKSVAPIGTQMFVPEELIPRLLAIVSDKTGYPEEMLDMTMDLEADLGIDSIKRVEILATLQEEFGEFPEEQTQSLSEIRTLGQIVERIQNQRTNQLQEAIDSRPFDEAEYGLLGSVSPQVENESLTKRRFVEFRDLPIPDRIDAQFPAGHVLLLADSGTGLGKALANCLFEDGISCEILENILPEGLSHFASEGKIHEEKLEEILAKVESIQGPIGGFIYFHPEEKGFDRHADLSQVKSLFFMAKQLGERLQKSGRLGRSCFVTVSQMDGQMGLSGAPEISPYCAAIPALVKTLNYEWPDVFCRSIDLHPSLSEQEKTERILRELQDPYRRMAEISYRSPDRRQTLRPVELDDFSTPPAEVIPTAEDVFLVSGGGRGITAACAVRMAERFGCRMILLGRTSIEEPIPQWAVSCRTDKDLKRSLVEQWRREGKKAVPAEVDRMARSIAARQEILKTLELIRKAGSEAVYIEADLSLEMDRAAIQRLIPTAWGSITGIVHGAGNLADKRIEKKTEADFDRVFLSKVEGFFQIFNLIDPQELKYLVLFSSVAGFFGNPGQSDYALANETLNKLAYRLQRQYPRIRVRALDWGPWDKGMVTADLLHRLQELNVPIISSHQGAESLAHELMGRHEHTQVVVGESLRQMRLYTEPILPMRIHRSLSVEANPYLRDHVVGGRAVLNLTAALSWMIQACQDLISGYEFVTCHDVRVLKGVVLEEASQTVELILDISDWSVDTSRFPNHYSSLARIYHRDETGKTVPHYSAKIQLSRHEMAHEKHSRDFHCATTLKQGEEIYRSKALFHGPLLQGVRRVTHAHPSLILAECRLPEISWQDQGQFADWTALNPFLADQLLQVGGCLIEESALPISIEQAIAYRPMRFDREYWIAAERIESTVHRLRVNIHAYDADGNLCLSFLNTVSIITADLKNLYRQNVLKV